MFESSLHITEPLTQDETGRSENEYDVGIVGGGLAGLALSIQLARLGHRVIVFEKEQYPFHKVCGEYISLESWNFLVELGLDLKQMNLPQITHLQVSSSKGTLFHHRLPLGGFGVSRFYLDHQLAKIAESAGVALRENSKVTDISFSQTGFLIETTGRLYRVRVACCSYGKRSNLDIKWKRPFTNTRQNKLNNFIAVKYHIQSDFPAGTIGLHTFHQGYCGIVKIEDDKYNLCYLATASDLRNCGNSISALEKEVLMKNTCIRKIFSGSLFLFDSPLTISQISFEKKAQVENHLLMIGDASGMITPLCGNGMSMALHGSKLAAQQVHRYLQGKINRKEMEEQYTHQWRHCFSTRLRYGRVFQGVFYNSALTDALLRVITRFPRLASPLIRQTHGNPF